MADNGYSDGSVVVSTELDDKGFEAGTEKIKNATESAIKTFADLGTAFDKYINQYMDAIPAKQFASDMKSMDKDVNNLSVALDTLSQAYSKTAEGGAKEIAQFERQADKVDVSLTKLQQKLDSYHGRGVMDKDNNIVSAEETEEIQRVMRINDDLMAQYNRMTTEVAQVKAAKEAERAAEIEAAAREKAEVEALKESTRKSAESNRQAWQSVKQEIKEADTATRANDRSYDTLSKTIMALQGKVDSLGPAAKRAMHGSEKDVDNFNIKMANTERAIQYAQEKLEVFGNTKIRTDEYNALNIAIEKASSELDSFYREQDRMLKSGKSRESQEWKENANKIAEAQRQLEAYDAEKQQLEASGNAFINQSDTARFAELASQFSGVSQQCADYQNKVDGASGKTRVLLSVLKALGKVGVTAFKMPGKSILSAVSGMKALSKGANSALGAVKKLGKTITSFGTRIKSLLKRRFISSILSGATEGIKNLAQASPEMNKSISAIMSALARLKNSFATAFSPILTIVSPVLTQIINILADACTQIGMFIAALTGATTVKKAVAVQKDYAASLNQTADSAEKANNSLAGFDKLNNTTSNKDSGASGAQDPASMFEEVPVESKIADFVKRLKNAFLKGDLSDIGKSIAGKINSVFKKINDTVSWDNVGGKIATAINSITSLINSLAENIDFDGIGKSFASGFNTIVNSIYLLVTGINWGNLGKSLMSGLNGFINNVDWGKLGTTIGSLFQSALSFINSALHEFDILGLANGLGESINNAFAAVDWSMLGDTLSTHWRNMYQGITTLASTIDWSQIGSDIATAINGIDWSGVIGDLVTMVGTLLSSALDLLTGLAETIDWAKLGDDLWNALCSLVTNIDWSGLIAKAFELLGAAVAGAVTLIGTFFNDLWEAVKTGYGEIKDYFAERVKAAGGDLWEGVLNGICEGLVSIGTWIKENIFDPFINGFKAVFGIHSPSTVMAEMGGFLIDGLKNGITNAWANIKQFFSDAWGKIKSSVKEACTSIKNTVSEKFTAAKEFISEKVTNIKNKVSEGFTNAYNAVSNKVSDIKNSVSNAFSNAYTTVSNKVSDIKNSVSNTFSEIWTSVSNKVSDIGSSIKNTFSDVVSSARSWGSDMCDNIVSGISNAASSVWDSAKNLAGGIKDFLGFSEPKKGPLSDFHTYMPDMIDLMVDGISKNKNVAIAAVSDLAAAISDEAQDASVVIPIGGENRYTSMLDSFADTITDAFAQLLSRLEAIANNVVFTMPAVATGTVIPYNSATGGSGSDHPSWSPTDILKRLDDMLTALSDIRETIEDKDTGITDEAIYTSVKRSVHREKKATGKNPLN